FDARNGGTFHQKNDGEGNGGRVLVSYKAKRGVEGAKKVSFPFPLFERAGLSCLRGVRPEAILPRKDKGPDKATVLSGRLVELEGEIEKVKTRLQGRYSDALADVLERHETELQSLTEQLAEANQEAASPLGLAWGECHSILEVIDAAP